MSKSEAKSTNEPEEPIDEHPWRSESTLREMYIEEGLSQPKIADRLGCSQMTVSKHLRENGIEARDRIEAAREARRVERASYCISTSGYEQWTTTNPDGSTSTVYVHQLLAISDGADPEKVFSDGEHHAHHACPIPWLNIGPLIDVLPAGVHQQTHEENEWTQQDGIPVLVSQTDS